MIDQGDELQTAQFEFNGAWMPDFDAVSIGAKNYKKLVNLRYTDLGLEGVQGYQVISTGNQLEDENAEAITDDFEALEAGLSYSGGLADYPLIRSGIQLRTEFDTDSYILVHAFNEAETAAKIFYNTTSVPDNGSFEETELLSDSTGNLGRFSKAPGGHIAYSNGESTYVWAGNEKRVDGFFTCTDSSRSNPIDKTDAVSNTLSTDATDYISVGVTAGRQHWVVFSSRPLQGVKYYVKTANTADATLSCTYWNGTTMAAVANSSDGTSASGKTLAATGTFSFDSTVGNAKPFHFSGMYMYAYQFAMSAGNADIYMVTVDAPFQKIVDVWDGVLRQPIQFQFYTGSEYRDFTLEVNEDSYTGYEIGAVLDGMTKSGKVIVMFDERMAAIKWKMAAGLTNTNTSAVTIKYWNGSAFATVGTVTDTTLAGGTDTLGQTGMTSWTPPAETLEAPVDLFGVYGYAYEITVSATLSGTADDDADELVVDRVTGIPAQKTMRGCKFPSFYKNMLLLCGDIAGKQGNRVDYSMPYSPDVYNGELSSMDQTQSLYFGDSEQLTAGCELFNRVGNNIISAWVALKEGSTYLLVGDSPEDFQIHPVSANIGCPAPLTLVTAEVGYDMAQDVTRNIAIWLSNSGPVVYDLAVITPLRGIDKFFKPEDPECINWDCIENSRGWFDQLNKEYNLEFPSGAGQITCNKWVAYDLIRKKWFEKDPEYSEFPQCGFSVMSAEGVKYIYGGIDTGYMIRLEYGPTWGDDGITQILETGDFFPTGNSWDMTRIREIKVFGKALAEKHDLKISHSANTDEAGGLAGLWADWDDCEWANWTDCEWINEAFNIVNFTKTGDVSKRILRETVKGDWFGWTHRLRFEITTDKAVKGFQPIGWGIRYRKERVE